MSESTAEIKEGTPLVIKRIYFAIHPGFTADPEIVGHVKPEWTRLHDKYLEQAKNLDNDDLMLVFTHKSFTSLRRDLKYRSRYTQMLKEMKSILGKRMVLISDNHDLFNSPEAFLHALKIIKGRGYEFSPDVDTFAFGETMELCVADGAENLNKSAGLTKKTIVLTDLTDYSSYDPKIAEAVRNRVHDNSIEKERLVFDNF